MVNVQGPTQICLKQIHFSFYPVVTREFVNTEEFKRLVKHRDTLVVGMRHELFLVSLHCC